MTVQQDTWTLVTDLLREARAELVPAANALRMPDQMGQGRAAQFEMFVDANELELAWDALADSSSSERFWDKMLVSAGLMRLAPQANLAATRLCNLRSHAEHA